MKTVIETFEEVNKRLLCEACWTERKKWEKDDHKKYGCYSNMIPGFYSKKPKDARNNKSVDVLIIAHSHGGGGDYEAFRQQREVHFEVESISSYYLHKDLDSFHQEQMRDLFNYLDGQGITWYFTDLVKCFVKHKEENFPIAIKHCKNYLKYQLDNLNFKLIICLGGQVLTETTELLGDRQKFEHGKLYPINNQKIVGTYFPAGFTANRWVAVGKWKKVLEILHAVLQ